jgi:D-aspartate ligase
MRQPAVEFDRSVSVLVFKIGRYPLHQGTVGAIRTLGRVGVPVYAITEDRFTPAALSRYLTGCFVWPTSGSEDENALFLGLAEVASRLHGPTVIVPTDDEAAVFLAERNDLPSHLVMPAVPSHLPRMLTSKRLLHKLCLEHGVPTPAAFFPTSADDVREFIDHGQFPVVVKNVDPWLRLSAPAVRSSVIVRTPDELAKLAQRWPQPANVMFQEYVPLDVAEDWILHSYCDRNARCDTAFTGVKLRQWPPDGGVTTYARVVDNPELLELGRTLCRRIGYRGITDQDWRFDRRDNRYKLLDFNPRIGANFRLFESEVGIDVVRALHLDLSGRSVPVGSQIDGRGYLVEHLYAAGWFFPRRSIRLRPTIGIPNGRVELAWMALDDPLPALAAVRFSLQAAFNTIRRSRGAAADQDGRRGRALRLIAALARRRPQ